MMQNIFVKIYKRFISVKLYFIFTLAAIVTFIVLFASKLKLNENINAIIPDDERINEAATVFNNSKLTDRLLIFFSFGDSTKSSPDSLKMCASVFTDSMQNSRDLIEKLEFELNENQFLGLYDFFYQNLPLYLCDSDYVRIEKQLTEVNIDKTLRNNFRSLISPMGIVTKEYIFKDPLSIVPLALKKLKKFQLDDNFIVHNSCIYTKDKKYLLVFIDPKYPSSQTDINSHLINSIEKAIQNVRSTYTDIEIKYYGGTAVAVANAQQIKKDITLTVSIAFVAIFFIFFFLFKRIEILLLFFLPVILGTGMALAVLSITLGSISAISLGIGAILIGISIDYSLHLFSHFRERGSIAKALNDVGLPIIMSSITTASAFLCLFIVKSEALNQLGLFGGLSVVFSALAVLTIMPVFLSKREKVSSPSKSRQTLLDAASRTNFESIKPVRWAVIIITVVLFFIMGKVRINSDIATFNYMPDHLAEAELQLENISSAVHSTVNIIAKGKTLEEALQTIEKSDSILANKKAKPLYSEKSSYSDLVLSKAKQEEKIKKWNSFWNKIDTTSLQKTLIEKGKKYHFKANSFDSFFSLISKDFQPVGAEVFGFMHDGILQNHVSTNKEEYSIASVLKVKKENKEKLFELLEKEEKLIIFDKQYFANKFFDIISEDFNKLVTISALIVFTILLVFFGRIEIAIISFAPIVLSWVWTLGLMGLFQVELNIFNIIISTFVFGLGIDYSIFITKGLISNYKYGNTSLAPYKLSVLLSVITTLIGIGVLIFAQHPALKSIALASIMGILSVLAVTFVILPLLFRSVTRQKGKYRDKPIVALDLLMTLLSFIVFLINSVFLSFIVLLLYPLPLKKRHKKYFFHVLVCYTSKFVVWINFTIKKEYINKQKLNFDKPSILVSNHQSHIDLVLFLQLHPKIIVITNKWVWNSPFYGLIIRYADYLPIYEGLDKCMEQLKAKTEEGYSVLIFPEGTRTVDGTIKRFHQGALKLAADLNLELQPVLIHGAFDCLPKTDFILRSGKVSMKFFNKREIQKMDVEKKETYRLQAKDLTRSLRKNHEALTQYAETTAYIKQKVISKYLFKGPMLEWYVRVKLKMEKNYDWLDEIVPKNGKIVDIGCGYGYTDFMLKYMAPDRKIIGIDYDGSKIELASNIAQRIEGLTFKTKDIVKGSLSKADVYILIDILHYMPKEKQLLVINKCVDRLSDQGIIIIRDADADQQKQLERNKKTERRSIKIFGFNDLKYKMEFIPGSLIKETAKKRGLACKVVPGSDKNTNALYILKK